MSKLNENNDQKLTKDEFMKAYTYIVILFIFYFLSLTRWENIPELRNLLIPMSE